MSDDEPIENQPTHPPRQENTEQDRAREDRYRRRTGIVLALLAILAASISVLQTDASITESTRAREATRLAVQAQSDDVLAEGLAAAVRDAFEQIDALDARAVFADPVTLGSDLGIEIDPERALQRTDAATRMIESSIADGDVDITALAEKAAATSLTQSAAVAERIEWNAKASQYETVLTVLAIAVFLVGFTLVIGRRLRPPVAVPGVLLALYCIGWAAVIYSHPVPTVDPEVVGHTAAGQVALEEDRAGPAVTAFDSAIELDPVYVPALNGRALATLVEANPDLLETLAVTSSDRAAIDSALVDLRSALDHGGADDPGTLKLASLVALLGGRWEMAEEFLDRASEADQAAAALYLWHAAVEVALDHPEAAQDWIDAAVDDFAELDLAHRRELLSQYLSLLEVVAEGDPARASAAADFAQRVVALATSTAVDRELVPIDTAGVTFAVEEAGFDSGITRLRFDLEGVDDDTAIAIVGYERPVPGATWVQPAELFYAGDAATRGEGVVLETPRSCAPVQWRFELYVEGEAVRSVDAPGVAATC